MSHKPAFEWGVRKKKSPHAPHSDVSIAELLDKVDNLEFELRAIRKRLTEMENKWQKKP